MEAAASRVDEEPQRTERTHRDDRSPGQYEPCRFTLRHPQRHVCLGPVAERDNEVRSLP